MAYTKLRETGGLAPIGQTRILPLWSGVRAAKTYLHPEQPFLPSETADEIQISAFRSSEVYI